MNSVLKKALDCQKNTGAREHQPRIRYRRNSSHSWKIDVPKNNNSEHFHVQEDQVSCSWNLHPAVRIVIQTPIPEDMALTPWLLEPEETFLKAAETLALEGDDESKNRCINCHQIK